MKHITSLHKHLLANVEHLQANPDRLFVTVKDGTLTWGQDSLSHKQQYKALVEIDEYPTEMDETPLFLAIIDWYNQNQEPFDYKKPPVAFESYKISNGSTTIVFVVDIKENVVVSLDEHNKPLINVCDVPGLSL